MAGGFTNGDTFIGYIQHATAAEWERTVCTWLTGGIVQRAATPLQSSTGSKIAFSAGVKTVSVVESAAPQVKPFRKITAGSSTTMVATEYEIYIATGAAHAVTLPAIAFVGQRHRITVDGQVDIGVNEVTVSPASGTINGAATLVYRGARMSLEFVAVSATEWQTRF